MESIRVGDIVEVQAEYPGVKGKNFRGIVTKLQKSHGAFLVYIRYPRRLQVWKPSPYGNNVIVDRNYVRVIL